MAKLVSKGVKGGAYVVVLPREANRQAIYEGTLESGQGHRFVGHRLWVYVFAPANLRLKLKTAAHSSCPARGRAHDGGSK